MTLVSTQSTSQPTNNNHELLIASHAIMFETSLFYSYSSVVLIFCDIVAISRNKYIVDEQNGRMNGICNNIGNVLIFTKASICYIPFDTTISLKDI